MKSKAFQFVTVCAVCALCAGCVNCHTRFPLTDARIEAAYQSTRSALGCSIICAFPQMMSDCPSDDGFKAYNVLTVPLGLLVLCDALCEAVVDTVLFPVDFIIYRIRKAK